MELKTQSRISIIKSKPDPVSIDFGIRRNSLMDLVEFVTGRPVSKEFLAQIYNSFERPNFIVRKLFEAAHSGISDIIPIGTIESRFFIVRHKEQNRVFTFGDYDHHVLPKNILKRMSNIKYLKERVFEFTDQDNYYGYLKNPKVFLTALYHPETFPLPRFSLAISDLIRAARIAGVAHVEAEDMQLGIKIEDIVARIIKEAPDIIGISATFGQQDVLDNLMSSLIDQNVLNKSQIVFGGSLSALNRVILLEKYPNAIVALGAGENTISDLIAVSRGELEISKVNGIAYKDANGEFIQTRVLSPRQTNEMLPELDLLRKTLSLKGVMQLESSRGCSYACSFCPRTHKGIWSGDDPHSLKILLPDICRLLDDFPEIARKIYLVDEEFFGYQADGESDQRVLDVASELQSKKIRFETSSRADQVFRPHKDKEWHINRLTVWQDLVARGLDRCLFGIESGVDSILKRFNKKSNSEQNSTAIRLLSLLGVPPRYTYITFDPLMSRDELIATYLYQGRTDLILKKACNLTTREIFHTATNAQEWSKMVKNEPFYRSISYMLVTMECLIDAPYTSVARSAGLTGTTNSNMGRIDSKYVDLDIGVMAFSAQCWIDRNFALDYLFKSIEKYTTGEVRSAIRKLRSVVKDYAYELLGLMLGLWGAEDPVLGLSSELRSYYKLQNCSEKFKIHDQKFHGKFEVTCDIMDLHFDRMVDQMRAQFQYISPHLPSGERSAIEEQLDRWSSTRGWDQINAL